LIQYIQFEINKNNKKINSRMNKIFNQNCENIIDKEKKKNKVNYLLNNDINELKKNISYLKLCKITIENTQLNKINLLNQN
jgi:hypothetical protein